MKMLKLISTEIVVQCELSAEEVEFLSRLLDSRYAEQFVFSCGDKNKVAGIGRQIRSGLRDVTDAAFKLRNITQQSGA